MRNEETRIETTEKQKQGQARFKQEKDNIIMKPQLLAQIVICGIQTTR